MKLIPQKLPIGARHLGPVPRKSDGFYSVITDERARYAFKVDLAKGGYYIVDGRRERRIYSALDDIDFSGDGSAYAYSTLNSNGVVVNGKRMFGRGYGLFSFEQESPERWTCRRYVGRHGWHAVSPRGEEDYPLCNREQFTPDGRHLLYVANHPEGGTPLICDGEILFRWWATEVSRACDRYPYVSWIGNPEKDSDCADYVYLLGKRKERIPAYFEAMTFTVSENHRRHMYGAAEENVEDKNGKFIGEQHLYLDGVRQTRVWQEVEFWQSDFSHDSRRWTYVARDHGGKHRVIVDGEEIAAFDRCYDNHFSPRGSRHGAIGWQASPAELRKGAHLHGGELARGFAVVDGKVYDPGRSIVSESLAFSPNDRHFAFISRDRRHRQGDRLHLNGEAIDEADSIHGAQTAGFGSPAFWPRFSSDSARLYYFSIRDGELYFNVARVA